MKHPRRLSEGALTAMELAAIDMAIFAKQAAGFTIGSLAFDDDDEKQDEYDENVVTPAEMAADRAQDRWEERHANDMHGGELTDAIVLEYVTSLAGRLAERADLELLVAVRGEALAGPR